MIIPLNWLADYIDDLPQSEQTIADAFTTLGLMQEKPIKNHILELEHRMDRSDWLSIIGCARDLSAFLNLKLKLPKIPTPKLKQLPPDQQIKIKVSTPTVRRFNTRIFKNIQVKPSPQWLVKKLEAYGIPSVNNIVDITNFAMVEYGQPMHAQDLNKLPQPELNLRPSQKGEQITTLLGTTVKLPKNTFIISSGKQICVIGGIVGGQLTGVTKTTTQIILDAGNYDQKVIRSTSRKIKIQNETVSRYDKYLDPRLTEVALNRATDLILQLAGGEVYQNHDYYPQPIKPQTQQLTLNRLKLLSGLDINLATAKQRLAQLGYQIIEEDSNSLTLEIPYWRTDIDVEDDLVADILRIGNYNTIPNSPLNTPIPNDITSKIYKFENYLRQQLVALTAQEHITSPLVKYSNLPNQIKLANALSSQQNALRTSLSQTLTPLITSYQKHQVRHILIFEIAKSFQMIKNQPQEIRELTVASNQDVRHILIALMNNLQINYQLKPDNQHVSIYHHQTYLGQLHQTHFTLQTQPLMKLHSSYPKLISNYQNLTSIDLSLNLPENIYFNQIEANLQQTDPSLQYIKVLENNSQKHSLLIRLYWTKLKNPDKTRLQLVKALNKIKVTSRSIKE